MADPLFKFNRGDILKDSITQFQGAVVARHEWLNGCIRYSIQPTKLAKDGQIAAAEVIDEQQLMLVKAAAKPKAGKVTSIDRMRAEAAQDRESTARRPARCARRAPAFFRALIHQNHPRGDV